MWLLAGADDTGRHARPGIAGGKGDHRGPGASEQVCCGEGVGRRHQLRAFVLADLQRCQVSAVAGMPTLAGNLECPPAERKSPGAPPVGATELGSHLPTEWMCRPGKPGVSLAGVVVWTVIVAKPPVKSMSAVATVVPSASFRWAVSFSPVAAWPVVCPPLVGDGAAGDTDGVVPGEVATG